MGGAGNDGRGTGRVNVFSPDCFLWFILHCEWEELAMIGVAWTGLMCSVQTADFLWAFCTVGGGRRQCMVGEDGEGFIK